MPAPALNFWRVLHYTGMIDEITVHWWILQLSAPLPGLEGGTESSNPLIMLLFLTLEGGCRTQDHSCSGVSPPGPGKAYFLGSPNSRLFALLGSVPASGR